MTAIVPMNLRIRAFTFNGAFKLKYKLHLHPHAADAAVGEITIQKQGRRGPEHVPSWNLSELRMVQGIKSFPAKLHAPLLSDLDRLEKAHVKVVYTPGQDC